jgi:hypothetical protein
MGRERARNARIAVVSFVDAALKMLKIIISFNIVSGACGDIAIRAGRRGGMLVVLPASEGVADDDQSRQVLHTATAGGGGEGS